MQDHSANDAEFYVLVRATRDKEGAQNGSEFVQARKTKPEPGLIRDCGLDECWIKVRSFVPTSVMLGLRPKRDPVGCWAEPVLAPDLGLV